MNSPNNGTNLQLQKFKESTSKKRLEFQRKAILKFLFIFVLSHLARTLISIDQNERKPPERKQISKGHVHMNLEVYSLIPKNEKKANLFHGNKKIEIENVHVLESKELDNNTLLIKIELPSTSVSKIIENPSHWKLIPKRKVSHKKRRSYEILL